MSAEMTERGIGLELVQQNIALILVENINEEIDLQEAAWSERDTEWASLTGQPEAQVSLEYVDSLNIFKGHRPSLVKSMPPERFPNISVMAYQARPRAVGETIDQATNYNLTIDIEAFIKADSEEESDARIHRITEAIHQVLVRNESLNGLSFGWENDPIIITTDVMARNDLVQDGTWYWQGVRLRYAMARHTRLPS